MPYKLNPITKKFDYYEPMTGVTVQETDIQFHDPFDDGSLFWAWDQVAGNGSVSEAGDVLTLSIANGQSGRWENGQNTAPRIFTGLPGSPCIILTKLENYTVNDETFAGLHVSAQPEAGFNNQHAMFGRMRSANAYSKNGLVLFGNNAVQASNAVTTLPIYLRIRLQALGVYTRLYADYSTDGSSWTALGNVHLYTDLGMNASWETMYAGLFAANDLGGWGANAIDAPFGYFTAYRSFGPSA